MYKACHGKVQKVVRAKIRKSGILFDCDIFSAMTLIQTNIPH